MKNILIIGATGQIGSELTMELRRRYGNDHVVAGYRNSKPSDALADSGPLERVDITNAQRLNEIVKRHGIDTIYNLAALLSAIAEDRPQAAWHIGINGLYNVLETARENGCAVFFPSSIGSFGPSTPRVNTPQETIQRPTTMYGVTKVTGELLSDYYHRRFGLDTRGVRYPGIISSVTLPGGGTTDYAVEIFYAAIKHKKFVCPLPRGAFLDMMYMPDALNCAIDLMEADPSKLIHRNAFNVSAMSFDPEILAAEIKRHMPDFEMTYNIDPKKQAIAASWPNNMDDSAARSEWGWKPEYNFKEMVSDMMEKVSAKLAIAYK
ncbi:NAD-dependent nucleotide-diphosphate-sugar epimerase family protein [Desulforapulum autotrophicum HRM2]|uniref:NAD-dependent nucleotide-diphosphate-sugar epimerase family protein n=1 Tax=Desulforapulum autotrophicum (strain ATCC 43914 / DSM 3382 / VKM B-1955 / HRM2) TaxID=177437 RepID=C0QBE3_DESAH|nr:NAD-dependent epimerase/dehydratase family protein [Desulforapulum autotrophicum]ACN16945.1 NAD-dependent nucleotide-diphosphate-sugar epimerase family protein [Desulforapulum autotrophicum HRM2]